MSSDFPATVEVDISDVIDLWDENFKSIFLNGNCPDFYVLHDEMVLIRQTTNSSNYISEENLVKLMHLRDKIHISWNTIPAREKEEIVHVYTFIGTIVDKIISRMQLYVLLEKLKEWCT